MKSYVAFLGMLARMLTVNKTYIRMSRSIPPRPISPSPNSTLQELSAGEPSRRLLAIKLFTKIWFLIVVGAILLGTFDSPSFLKSIAGHKEALAQERRHTPEYDALKARYNKLRNTDPAIERMTEWEELVDDLEKHADIRSASQDRSASLYHAALLCAELSAVGRDSSWAKRSEDLLQQIVSESPEGSFADDALLRLGDLQRTRGEEESARETYEKLQRDYPKSELRAVASARILELEGRDKPGKKTNRTTTAKSEGPIIVIDPGHGGEDLGAKGVGGLLEKDVTISVARELADILRSKHGATVKLTRVDDVFVPLADRTAFANDLEADVFISLHANASPSGKLNGLETFILDNAEDKATKLLAERENASIQFEGQDADLQFMLSDLLQSSKLNESKQLAENIQLEILRTLDSNFTRPKDLGVKKAPFYVLVGAHMPSVLVEMGFIDNVQEGRSLAEKGFRRAIAEGIAKGLSNYLKASGKG